MKQLKYVLTLCALLLACGLFVHSSAVAAGICTGTTGNVNCDATDNVDIGDLTALIDNLFISFTPLCSDVEANCDGTGGVDIGDLTALIDNLFVTFTPLANCPDAPEVVFNDQYGNHVTYQAFAGSKYDAVQLDGVTKYAGSNGLVITVPGPGDPSGSYAGGAFTDSVGRDLSVYNCLTFWAKASKAATLNVAGIGNNNTGNSKYTGEVGNLALTTSWQKFIIPLPLASKLTTEQGLFYFAEGAEDGAGYQIYIDEIIFENLAGITNPRPDLGTPTLSANVGEVVNPGNVPVTFAINSVDLTISAMSGYFTFTSSAPSVVSVGPDGVITALSVGTATLTAKLGAVDATGSITVNVSAPEAVPTVSAPTPTLGVPDVVSLFSDAYTSNTVDTWSAGWDMADVSDYTIGTDNLKKYSNLVFAGIEFTSSTLDASAMTHFHMDVWTPNSTDAPAVFKVKLVDFGGNGVWGGGDDVEHELTFDETTMNTGSWVGIDVPLSAFTNLVTRGHLAQMIISGSLSTVYLDNIYFYKSSAVAPTTSAPTPSAASADVVSLFSDAYTNNTVDTWSAGWDMANVADFALGPDNMKKYTSLVFAGIEFITQKVDASTMTSFHMDLWTPDPTTAPAVFKVKLVDVGADGNFGGGDDVEHELTFDHTTLFTGSWVSIDVPLSAFTNLTTRGHLAQMIISGSLSTVYLDNIYFYKAAPTAPPTSAPTPSYSSSDVVSLFSDAYTNHTVDTWSAGWDMADVSDYTIGPDNLKEYTNLVYAGIEFTSSTVDASSMTYFHMDVWTPNPTDAPVVFKVKLVDFGADGAWSGGDDVEHELTFDETTMNTGSWVSIDVPLSDFTNLTTRGHLAQMIVSGGLSTVYIDNVYFHK